MSNIDNSIKLVSIPELLDFQFFIADYQRGYRWTDVQVWELLEDISEFVKKDKKNYEFYCLQPIVVKKIDNPRLNKDCFEVIDGQQRIITIYLILFYLKDAISILSLPEKNFDILFHRKIGGCQSIEFLNEKIITENCESIDLYHLSLAYKTIDSWFAQRKVNKGVFCNALLSYVNDDNNRDKSNNIRFIWYETTEKNPISVFTRLNIGKICLTNAELIKAIFLNSSNFKEQDSSLKLRQQEISSEWDRIEYTLQNDEFWLFIRDTDYEGYTRIDFIFDLICEQNLLELKDTIYGIIGSDNYRTFRYFYEYFRRNTSENSIKKCWQKIKKIYQTFCEWYDDVELYHYIGFLIEYKTTVSDLLKKWNLSKNKIDFLSQIKSLIKVQVTDNDLDFQYKEDGSNKRECKPILLFHNIQTVINQNFNLKKNNKYHLGIFYKFPFHLYKIEKWDVEHISSSTTNSEDELTIKKEWLINIYLSSNSNAQEKIEKCLSSDECDETEINSVYDELKPQTKDNSQEWTDSEKNKIWNYVLLDSSTNRSYGNIIFSGKRRILIGKDKGKYIEIPRLDKGHLVLSEEKEAISSFIPLCTKNVFMKYYSPSYGSPNYWTKEDAEAYKLDIEKCIKQLNKENC